MVRSCKCEDIVCNKLEHNWFEQLRRNVWRCKDGSIVNKGL